MSPETRSVAGHETVLPPPTALPAVQVIFTMPGAPGPPAPPELVIPPAPTTTEISPESVPAAYVFFAYPPAPPPPPERSPA